MRPTVVVRTVISRGRDKENTRIADSPDRVFNRPRVRCRTPTCTDYANVNAMFLAVDSVVDSFDGVVGRSKSTAAEKLQRHDLNLPINARDTDAVITLGPDDDNGIGVTGVNWK